MKFKNLGRSGLSVSQLCLGTMNFGPETDEATSHAIMDAALGYEINFFDTANRYGGIDNYGRTEEIIGRWFAQGGGRREKVVLATKLFGPMDPWPNSRGVSALNIRRACDASLKRMQTDYIDLYQMHHIDRSTPWEEVCRRWMFWSPKARSCMSEVLTSVDGISLKPRRLPSRAISWDLSLSNLFITW